MSVFNSVDDIKTVKDSLNGVLYIYADWCSSCDKATEFVNSLAKYTNVYSINIDDYGVEEFFDSNYFKHIPYNSSISLAVPYFMVILEGEILIRTKGIPNYSIDSGDKFFTELEDYVKNIFT